MIDGSRWSVNDFVETFIRGSCLRLNLDLIEKNNRPVDS